jgi:hypothetical protein
VGLDLIHQISSPFDFQHLSHTDRYQAAALDKPPGNKLAADFWTVHATPAPNQGLTGVKTDDLHFSNFSSENLATVNDRSASALSFRSPPQSPEGHSQRRHADYAWQVGATQPALRLARSVESFSQPSVSPRKQQHSQSLTSPPRSSSCVPSYHGEEKSNARGPFRSKRESGLWEHFAPSAATTPEQLPDIQEASSYFGHALTTPDDSAIHAMTPPFSPSLADVAEEPERFVSPRPAPQPPFETPTTPRSPYFESFLFQNQRPVSQNSETLGSQGLIRQGSVRRSSAVRRRSNTWRAIEESWEDDIDFAYDNALEADCDFEWDQVSGNLVPSECQQVSEPENRIASSTEDMETQSPVLKTATSFQEPPSSSCFRTSLLVPSASSVPDLIPTSAVSMSTISTGLPTPHESFNANPFTRENDFILTPSLLLPHEYKEHAEVSYEELLNEYDSSDRHYPMLDASQSTTSSARSSHVRSSRRSSYDSSLVSTQSSGLWSSPIRRSASSAGSVPDLVPSRRMRKDLGFSVVIDKLSEQVASLRHLNEDDDTTPPGRATGERTFFASDEEEVDRPNTSLAHDLRASLELARRGSQRDNTSTMDGELKVSMDLARQGSQRPNRTLSRQHKPALSDSAAKLLFSSSDHSEDLTASSRNRAATTTQARQPMLSLFPAPPRHTPTPTHF